MLKNGHIISLCLQVLISQPKVETSAPLKITVEENIRKLYEFYNNLGKRIRKLTNDTDYNFKKLRGKIKSLQEKNRGS